MLKASIFVNHKDPVMSISLLELTRIKFVNQILKSLNFCDSCLEPVSIIFADEESLTVKSVIKSLMNKSGFSIITDSGKDLSRKLELLPPDNQDINRRKESFSSENSDPEPVECLKSMKLIDKFMEDLQCPENVVNLEKKDRNNDDDDTLSLKIETIETVKKESSSSSIIGNSPPVTKKKTRKKEIVACKYCDKLLLKSSYKKHLSYSCHLFDSAEHERDYLLDKENLNNNDAEKHSPTRSRDPSIEDNPESTSILRNNLTNGSSGSESAKIRKLKISVENIDTKRKSISPFDPIPKRRLKLVKESWSTYDIVSGGIPVAEIEDIDCCVKCKMDNGHGAMVQCQGCQKWWHYHCVGLDEDSISRFKCSKCKFKHQRIALTKYRESLVGDDVDENKGVSKSKPIAKSTSKSSSGNQSKSKDRCKICKTLYFGSKKSLNQHYYFFHFKADILACIDSEGTKHNCKRCGYESFKKFDVVRHVWSCGDLLNEMVQGRKNVKKKKTLSEKSIKCRICFMNFKTQAHLSSHLSNIHYKLKLLKYTDSDNLGCLLCTKTFSDLRCLLAHVGSVHGKINEFLHHGENDNFGNSRELDPPETRVDKDSDRERALQEDLNLSDSSIEIEDLIRSDDDCDGVLDKINLKDLIGNTEV